MKNCYKKIFSLVFVGMLTLLCVLTGCSSAKGGDKSSQVNPKDVYTRINAEGVEDENGNYALFGYYPTSLKADDVTISDTADANGFFTGSDNCKYAKVITTVTSKGPFTNGNKIMYGITYYFKIEQIKWRIAKVSDDKALLISQYAIDAHIWDEDSNNYKDSDIRSWLNTTFLNSLSSKEQSIIQTTNVDNSLASTTDTENNYVCQNTDDKVFLLSVSDLNNSEYGFAESNDRRIVATDYARANNVVFSSTDGNANWWTRSPYAEDNKVSMVGQMGFVGYSSANTSSCGVVPAIWIKL